jgi:deoxyribodipyrimidine photo-lyase
VLAAAGVILGENYPLPVIDHRAGRERALAALTENKLRQRN